MVLFNAEIVANSGRFWGDVWLVGGVMIALLGLVLLMRERIKEVNNLRVEMP